MVQKTVERWKHMVWEGGGGGQSPKRSMMKTEEAGCLREESHNAKHRRKTGNGCGEADWHSVSIEVNEIGTGITDLTNAVKVCFVHDL